jgi:hypothetical protein
VSTEKDNRLVDYLYDELSEEESEAFERALESDEALSSELASMEQTLDALRTVEAEDPSPHLDSLILAHARQEAGEKKSWWRKVFASPVAGLVTAASVAMLAALVAVPTMMRSSDEYAPTTLEQSVQRIPTPIEAPVASAPVPQPDPAPAIVPADEPEREAKQEVKKLRRAAAPKKKAPAAPPAPPKTEPALDSKKDSSARAAGPPAPARAMEPAQPMAKAEASEAEELRSRDEDDRLSMGRVVDAREEKGRAMLRAASEEFKRGNPEGGRRILLRALSEAGDAPVHAEIAFRLAQHDYDRGEYADAIVHARIAAAVPSFDKRAAAVELMARAQRKLEERRSNMLEAPAESDSAR